MDLSANQRKIVPGAGGIVVDGIAQQARYTIRHPNAWLAIKDPMHAISEACAYRQGR